MESIVTIKASSHDMREAFENNEVFSVRYYKQIEPLINESDVNEITLFEARIRHREIAKELQNRIYTIKGLEKAILKAPTEKPKIQLVKVLDCTIPYYGNKHLFPYGTLLIVDGNGERRTVKTQEENGYTFIKVNGFTYYVKGLGRGTCTIE